MLRFPGDMECFGNLCFLSSDLLLPSTDPLEGASPTNLQMALIKTSQALLRNNRNFPSQTGITGNQGFPGGITLIRNVGWVLLLILQGTACPKSGHAAEKQGAIFACFSFL